MMQYRVNTCRIDPLAADQMVRPCILPGHASGSGSMLCMYVALPPAVHVHDRKIMSVSGLTVRDYLVLYMYTCNRCWLQPSILLLGETL